MVRKISFSILSAAILVFGLSAFSKLDYWERSTAILTFIPQTAFPESGGYNHERTRELNTREERERSGDGRERTESDEDLPEDQQWSKSIPDSIDKAGLPERGLTEKGSFRDGNDESHRDGDSHGGNKINMGKVFLFLAVFASFTIIAIYAERGIQLICKHKTG
jgi:hypothetical protein